MNLPSAPLVLLFSALALSTPVVELPVSEWVSATENLDSLSLEFSLLSEDGEVSEFRFLYEAPGHCHVEVDGEGRIWIEDGRTTALAEDDETVYIMDVGPVVLATHEWCSDFRNQLPREENPVEFKTGPVFMVWPNASEDKVEMSLSYGIHEGGLLDWLQGLEQNEYEVTELEDGYELVLDDDLRIVLEPQLGVPRGAWIGEGDERRKALSLIAMELDGPLEIPEAPDPDEDVSEGVTKQLWGQARTVAHHWLWYRQHEDSIDLDEDERQIVRDLFQEHHDQVSAERILSYAEKEFQSIDQWIAGVQAWYDGAPDKDRAQERIDAFKASAEDEYSQVPEGLVNSYLGHLKEMPSEVGSQGDFDEWLELERDGARAFLEEAFVTPTLEHLRAALEDLG
jgi:hypothetical protein